MTETVENGRITADDKKKYLFLKQLETLDSFLKNGAISRAQYDFSYSGLVTKMNITRDELSAWLGELNSEKQGENI